MANARALKFFKAFVFIKERQPVCALFCIYPTRDYKWYYFPAVKPVLIQVVFSERNK
jgi:hypothetical protein